MNTKYLSLILLLSFPLFSGITKNNKVIADFDCGVKFTEVNKVYRIYVTTGNPKYDGGFVECDDKQQFKVDPKEGIWTNAAALKVGDKIQSALGHHPTRSIFFPITKIEVIEGNTRSYTILDCPWDRYMIGNTELMTRNQYTGAAQRIPTQPELQRLLDEGRSFIEVFDIAMGNLKRTDPEKYNANLEKFFTSAHLDL